MCHWSALSRPDNQPSPIIRPIVTNRAKSRNAVWHKSVADCWRLMLRSEREWRQVVDRMRLNLGTGQGQGQAKWGRRMKMWHECRVTPDLRVIWDVEYDGNTHFHIWPKVRSNSDKKCQNFDTQFFKHACLASFISGLRNVVFWLQQLEMRIIAFFKSVITFTWFFDHCTAKNAEIGLKFCKTILEYSPILYISLFWFENWFVGHLFLKKWELEIWGLNRTN